ncbi:hypothetical protein MBAV_003690 [Candidatus Magnetobacterium bavaricum]|uniref:Uncharacterized protein n=1 Tax=Candidatus Magnetobacterium bavaricum TaxID=29290 RepID=A0A0F3GQA4_9BACT|nr:hypothetical protein MBAV_003690 [Candidatus Magnetobacterium bavaricum]
METVVTNLFQYTNAVCYYHTFLLTFYLLNNYYAAYKHVTLIRICFVCRPVKSVFGL